MFDPNLKPYPDYKLSGVEWLGDVPTYWEVPAIKKHYAIQLGKMLQNRPNNHADVEVPYLKAQHVQWFHVRTTDAPKMWASQDDIDQFGIALGDLLVCEGGEGGRCGILKQKVGGYIIQNALLGVARQSGIVSPSYAVYRPHPSSRLLGDYTDLLLRTTTYKNEYICRSTGIRSSRLRLYPEEFLRIKLLCPSLEEQYAIVEFVSKKSAYVRRSIDLARDELSLLDEYRTNTEPA